jgi:glucose/arabinose dehydrogenase
MSPVRLVFSLLAIGWLPSLGAEIQVRVQPFVTGLEKPVALVDDGSGRFFAVEQEGRIRLVQNNRVISPPYLDISKKVKSGGEMGLLGLAFHPQFSRNGRFFVNYTTTERGKLETVIAEFKASSLAQVAPANTEKELLRFEQPYPNHNGGHVAFGPDGMLYIGNGDGGSGGDPANNAQRLDTWLGKMLRIDVSGAPGQYAVPADNPFVGKEGARPEIWAWGLRNPWRFSFDRKTGLLYAGDVGQNKFEEVTLVGKGQNLGWSAKEGFHDFKPNRAAGPLVDPLAEYGRDDGVSITGGYVYRGRRFPALDGIYFYADYGSRKLWGLRWDGEKVAWKAELMKLPGAPSSFGEDRDGELYICDHGSGKIYRLVQ